MCFCCVLDIGKHIRCGGSREWTTDGDRRTEDGRSTAMWVDWGSGRYRDSNPGSWAKATRRSFTFGSQLAAWSSGMILA